MQLFTFHPKIVLSCKISVLALPEITHITIIGTGRLAGHLAIALKQSGFKIVQVLGRRLQSAVCLAEKVQSTGIGSFAALSAQTDLFLLAVSDQAIGEVARQLPDNKTLVAHTSGFVGMEALLPFRENVGVLYPLQTFTKGRPLDYSNIPFFVEGNSPANETALRNLAAAVSIQVACANSQLRQKMHLAAVFACNFPNYLFGIADDILQTEGLTLDLLKPLLRETVEKALALGPVNAQTGPAVRNDKPTIEAHVKRLQGTADYREVYKFLTAKIIESLNK
jgi:predicted short-subunit dehydrogenase-like oxidoreductase (DUF2520 family)